MEVKPVEIIKETTDLALNIGEFVLDRLIGGAWAELSNVIQGEEDAKVQ